MFGPQTRSAWAARLRTLGRGGLESVESGRGVVRALDDRAPGDPACAALIASFADARGHRRAVDTWILRRVLGHRGGESPVDVTADIALFAALVTGAADPLALVDDGNGALVPFDGEMAIERWTEIELGALHALGVIAADYPSVRERVRSAAAWHVAELQPDNGTNHAWALHVFLELGIAGDAGAMMHAGTLIQNAVVGGGGGVPDAFSGLLMIDAAMVLGGGGWLGG
jgi:hypothetical protein